MLHFLVVMALLALGEHVKGGGGVLAEPAAVRICHLVHAVAGGQTETAALLAAVTLDEQSLQAVEGEGQRVADVYDGLVLGEAGHLVKECKSGYQRRWKRSLFREREREK